MLTTWKKHPSIRINYTNCNQIRLLKGSEGYSENVAINELDLYPLVLAINEILGNSKNITFERMSFGHFRFVYKTKITM